MHHPKKSHLTAVLRVIRYVKLHPRQRLYFLAVDSIDLTAFCDGDQVACPFICHSLDSYCVKLGSTLISCRVKKQHTISKSYAEAEYRSLGFVVSELIWLRGLMNEIGCPQISPFVVFYDNKSTLHIAHNPVFHERTEHTEIDCHFVRDKIKNGTIVTSHFESEDQLADLFTKDLTKQQHYTLLQRLGVKDLFTTKEAKDVDE